MGRPLVSTALVYADPDGGPLNHKGAYNKASSWGSAPPFVPQDFDDHLKAIDAIVSGNQWTPDGRRKDMGREVVSGVATLHKACAVVHHNHLPPM